MNIQNHPNPLYHGFHFWQNPNKHITGSGVLSWFTNRLQSLARDEEKKGRDKFLGGFLLERFS